MGVIGFLKYPAKIRHLKRIREITGVLIRHGFGDIAYRVHLTPSLYRLKKIFKKKEDFEERRWLRIEERIRLMFEELGTTFIKLGQVMATRPDLIPMSLVFELKKLHDDVPPFPFADVLKIIKEELSEETFKRFHSIEEKPVAAASIAQVHRAKLRDGNNVVIKVQRPNLLQTVRTDLEILKGLAKLLNERIPEIRRFNPVGVVDEFSRSLFREMDFKNELYNLQRYANNFKDEPLIYISKPYPELSTDKIITMEDVRGAKITDRDEIEKMGVDLLSIARLGMRVSLRSIFEFGFFHADPHPGNFFIRQDGSIALVDFGMMGSMESQRIDDLLRFLVAILLNDVEAMVNLFLDLDIISDDTDIRLMKSEIREILEKYQHRTIGEIDVSSFITEVFEVVVKHNVKLPSDLLLVGKAMATMEGIAREIHPDFNPLEEIRPYLVSIYMKRAVDPVRHSKNLYRGLNDLFMFLKDAPSDLRRIIKKVNRGEFSIQTKFQGREELFKQREKHNNKIISSIMVPSFLFCGIYALSLGSNSGDILSTISFLISGIFFINLIGSIFFSKWR